MSKKFSKKHIQKGGNLTDAQIARLVDIYNNIIDCEDTANYKSIGSETGLDFWETVLLEFYLRNIKGITQSAYIDDLKSKLSIPTKDNELPEFYKISDLPDISLQPGLYNTYIKSGKTVDKFITLLNKNIIEVSSEYIDSYYQKNFINLNNLFLRISKKLNNLNSCIKTSTFDMRIVLIINYLNFRLISILNRDLFLYIVIPRSIFKIWRISGNCYSSEVWQAIKASTQNSSVLKLSNPKNKLIIQTANDINTLIELQGNQYISFSETAMYTQNTINNGTFDRYAFAKTMITAVTIATVVGTSSAATWLIPGVALVSTFLDVVSPFSLSKFWETGTNINQTNFILNNYFIEMAKQPEKGKAIIDSGIASQFQEYITANQKNSNCKSGCNVEACLKKIENYLNIYKNLVKNSYESFKFYCYINKVIISWKCDTNSISKNDINLSIPRAEVGQAAPAEPPAVSPVEGQAVPAEPPAVSPVVSPAVPPETVQSLLDKLNRCDQINAILDTFKGKSDEDKRNILTRFLQDNQEARFRCDGRNTPIFMNQLQPYFNIGGRKTRKLRKNKTKRRKAHRKRLTRRH